MTATIVCVGDTPPQPWKNGGGTTRELLAWPSSAEWRVRISVADITRGGPFSTFPGVRRWIAVLDGAGVVLDIAGTSQRVTRADAPFGFDGSVSTGCELIDGPTRDLNLMLRRASGGLALVEDGRAWNPDAEMCGLFTAEGGRCETDGESFEATAFTLLWFTRAPAWLRFTAGEHSVTAPGWWISATLEKTSA